MKETELTSELTSKFTTKFDSYYKSDLRIELGELAEEVIRSFVKKYGVKDGDVYTLEVSDTTYQPTIGVWDRHDVINTEWVDKITVEGEVIRIESSNFNSSESWLEEIQFDDQTELANWFISNEEELKEMAEKRA